MSRPATPASCDGAEPAVPASSKPLRPSRPLNPRAKTAGNYSLFPTVVEATPPATPIALLQRSTSKSRGPPRIRSVSLDSTVRVAAGQQDAADTTVAGRKGREGNIEESQLHKLKHMSTVQEVPSPAVSIPYSFLPRNSEDAGHTRSSSAPGEVFLRDSQTLPSAKLDLSKPQWTSKQASNNTAKGLGLSMPASVSADRLDQKQGRSTGKVKPNLTIEIKNDPRMKPKAIVVRDNIEDDKPPPPPPKSPRHDSRNQSLSNIAYEPRKARRTHSRSISRSTAQSNNSPDSEEATVAAQGSFVKASLVKAPSPSSTPPMKPTIPVSKNDTSSPLSGDVRIKELMAMTGADDDFDRPIPPPITPGRPRVASIGRMVSGPRSVATEKAAGSGTEQTRSRPATRQDSVNSQDIDASTDKIARSAIKCDGPTTESKMEEPESKLAEQPQAKDAKADAPLSNSSAPQDTKRKTPKPNLDKPMPSLPPPSSRQSQYMREVRAAEEAKKREAAPMPSMQKVHERQASWSKRNESKASANAANEEHAASHSSSRDAASKQSATLNDHPTKQEEEAAAPRPANTPAEHSTKAPEKATKGPALSAFPAIPAPPRYYSGSPRMQSPASGQRRDQPPPPRDMQRPASPFHKQPANSHPMQRAHSPLPSAGPPSANRPGPPRSRFYGRQPESANASQVTLVDSAPTNQGWDEPPTRQRTAPTPEPVFRTQSPQQTFQASDPPAQSRTSTQQRVAPVSTAHGSEKTRAPVNQDRSRMGTPDTNAAKPELKLQTKNRDEPHRAQSPAVPERTTSPTPSARPTSPADLLSRITASTSNAALSPATGPYLATLDTSSVQPTDSKPAIADPAETLKGLTRQSEALHNRYACLRADRLKLSTAITVSLRESKPGPEYANLLLDQHLSLNAINSSLDICFAKLKSLDCKKEEAMQALLEQTRGRGSRASRHRSSVSTSTHSSKASIASHSSKASTPEVGIGILPTLKEQEGRETVSPKRTNERQLPTESPFGGNSPVAGRTMKVPTPAATDSERESMDGLPTPRPTHPTKDTASQAEDCQGEASNAGATGGEHHAGVQKPTVSPPPSLYTNRSVDMSPVSPIEDNHTDATKQPKRITVKGAKAAKILGLVAGRSESPSGITLPDASPIMLRGSPGKEMTVELKIQRKPVPKPTKPLPPSPPTDSAAIYSRPGTRERSLTGQTDSSRESEVETPHSSDDDLVPKSLKIGRKPTSVQVVHEDDNDILDYYSR